MSTASSQRQDYFLAGMESLFQTQSPVTSGLATPPVFWGRFLISQSCHLPSHSLTVQGPKPKAHSPHSERLEGSASSTTCWTQAHRACGGAKFLQPGFCMGVYKRQRPPVQSEWSSARCSCWIETIQTGATHVEGELGSLS